MNPREINLKINDRLTLTPINAISPYTISQIQDRLTFDNPEFQDREKRGFSTWSIDREITGCQVEGDSLIIPRGFISQLLGILQRAGVAYRIDDRRRALPEVDFSFRGDLRDFQIEALNTVTARSFGTLTAPTGSGKTVMGLAIIAKRRQPTLVIVHNKELLNQWIERAETFLGIPKKEIGIIGGGKKTIGEKLTIGIVNSVYPIAHEIREHFGFIIVDECHRCPSRTFLEAVTAFDSKYMLGLSATPWRRDGLSRFIFWYLGDVVHEVDRAALIEDGHVLEADIITRETEFKSRYDASSQYSIMLSDLTQDQTRNSQIINDVIEEAKHDTGVCLVLTDRKAHCEALAEMITEQGIKAEVLHGDLSARDRQSVVERLNTGFVRILVATGQLIGEGFDCRDLTTLFLATPIKFDGRLLQYLGRVLRPAPGKGRARVFDYVDNEIGVLKNAARVRRNAYKSASCQEAAA